MALYSDGLPKPVWAAEAHGDRGVEEDCGCGSGGGVLDGEPVWILRAARGIGGEGREEMPSKERMPFRDDANWQNMHKWAGEEPCGGGICSCQLLNDDGLKGEWAGEGGGRTLRRRRQLREQPNLSDRRWPAQALLLCSTVIPRPLGLVLARSGGGTREDVPEAQVAIKMSRRLG